LAASADNDTELGALMAAQAKLERQWEAEKRTLRLEQATYTSQVVQLRRDFADVRTDVQGLRELVEMTLATVQTSSRASVQATRKSTRAAAAIGPGVLVLLELVRYVLEHAGVLH